MYVSESGVAGTSEAGVTGTGRVSKYLFSSYVFGWTAPAWSVGFTSFYDAVPMCSAPKGSARSGMDARTGSRVCAATARFR